MISYYSKKHRSLSAEVILQCFLKNLLLRQSMSLARIPKLLSTHDDWFYEVVLRTVFIENTDRTVPLSQLEHDTVIPIADEMLLQIEDKLTDCDAIIFHRLPLSKNIHSCVQSLGDMSARIIKVDNTGIYPVATNRIDVAFTPVWFKKGKNTMITMDTCKRIIKEYETEKLDNKLRTILIDFGYGTMGRSEVITEIHKVFSAYLKKTNQ